MVAGISVPSPSTISSSLSVAEASTLIGPLGELPSRPSTSLEGSIALSESTIRPLESMMVPSAFTFSSRSGRFMPGRLVAVIRIAATPVTRTMASLCWWKIFRPRDGTDSSANPCLGAAVNASEASDATAQNAMWRPQSARTKNNITQLLTTAVPLLQKRCQYFCE